MGAYMSQVAAAELPFPVGIAALAGGDSARDIYARGCLSLSIDFEHLGGGDALAAADRLGGYFHASRSSLQPRPQKPQAAVIVGARHDGYVPPGETTALHAYWPGSELRWVPGGHISAVVTQRQTLRQALRDALDRA
jgi:pimeloyl-ACP methyl ester carboxylesterase